jgi:hypothetical protein
VSSSAPFLKARPRFAWDIIVVAEILVFAGLIAYSDSLSGPFVHDDFESIRDNSTIRQLWPPAGLLTPPHDGATVGGRPMLNVSFALNYAFGGLPRG